MKKQKVLLLLIALISWVVVGAFIAFVKPMTWKTIASFLVSIFFALTTAVSLILYFLSCLGVDRYVNRKQIFRESLRRGGFVGGVSTIIGILLLIDAATKLNTTLLITIAVVSEYYFTKYHG